MNFFLIFCFHEFSRFSSPNKKKKKAEFTRKFFYPFSLVAADAQVTAFFPFCLCTVLFLNMMFSITTLWW
jgi:hypothetical protein